MRGGNLETHVCEVFAVVLFEKQVPEEQGLKQRVEPQPEPVQVELEE